MSYYLVFVIVIVYICLTMMFISVEKYTSNSIQKYTIIGKNPIVESISWDIPTY